MPCKFVLIPSFGLEKAISIKESGTLSEECRCLPTLIRSCCQQHLGFRGKHKSTAQAVCLPRPLVRAAEADIPFIHAVCLEPLAWIRHSICYIRKGMMT
jgi:hypothetical protein